MKKDKNYELRLKKAIKEYFDKKNRNVHPEGYFDNKKRWYPSVEEEQSCCKNIRTPSAHFPFSKLTHCRSALHISKKNNVDVKELRSMIKNWHLLVAEVQI